MSSAAMLERAKNWGAETMKRRRGTFGGFNILLSFALALLVWAVMQTDVGQRSFLPAADNESLDWAFQIRDDQALRHLGPTVILDIDDRAWSAAVEERGAALAYAPRDDIARGLELARGEPGGRRPAAVIVDTDLSWRSPDEASEQRIDDILGAWASDPDAPLLILIREPAAGDDTPAAPLRFREPARTAIFATETTSAPIVVASARASFDDEGRPELFNLYSCVEERGEVRAMASPILFATVARRAPSAEAAVASVNAALADATAHCRGERSSPAIAINAFDRGVIKVTRRSSYINYNASVPLDAAAAGRIQIARELLLFPIDTPVSNVIPAGGGSPAVVIIGSSASHARDYFRTPIGEMSGSAVLINALRGFEAAGPLQNFPPLLDITMIGLAVLIIGGFFSLARGLRHRIGRDPNEAITVRFGRAFARFMLNPVSVEILASILVVIVGFTITYFALDYGYFAGIAGPSFAAAFNEARQEFEELTANVWGHAQA